MNDEDFEEKLQDLRNLYKIINNVKNEKKKFILNYKLQTELDYMIDKIEEYYYLYVLKNKKEDKIKNEADKIIYNSRKTMNAFLPYILLYNLTNNLTDNLTDNLTQHNGDDIPDN
tara:strand:+ start:3637 stop:3981 length:345 start_codon:yes stop_codon:yes gene_type:complete